MNDTIAAKPFSLPRPSRVFMARAGDVLVRSILAPLFGIGLFLALWGAGAAQVQTSLGELPGPVAVWHQAVGLYQAHVAERQEETEFYQRQDECNAKRLEADPNAEERIRPYTGSPTFAVVFPVSAHAYQLRYWMGAAGIDPDRDVLLLVVPPPQMVSQLKAGHIDGFCVSAPWNKAAVAEGLGRVLITSYELWNNSPEKVFGVNQEWAEQHPNTHRAVLMALLEASRWLDAHENRPEVVDIISRPAYVNAPKDLIGMSMTGTFRYGPGEDPVVMPDFNVFFRFAANFPWRSHAEWFIGQMVRWGQIEDPVDIVAKAARVYRPDLYREAAEALGLAVPSIDRKPEGGHGRGWTLTEATQPLAMGSDRFFDGGTFDPDDPITGRS